MPLYNKIYAERKAYEFAYLGWIYSNIPKAILLGRNCAKMVFRNYMKPGEIEKEKGEILSEEQRIKEVFGL